MVMMLDRGSAQLGAIAPLPPFVTAQELLADAIPMMDAPTRMSPTEAAERYMRVPVRGSWQNFDKLVTPYTVEPVDQTQSRRFKGVCFVGPSQSGKSQMLLTAIAHSVMCAPDPVQLIHMTKTDADAWVEEKLDPTIFNSPLLLDRLGKAREDSTFSRKRFQGMRLGIGYPVANQLSSRSQRIVLLTDYDHMPQRLGPKDSPESTVFMMAMQRIRTFMSRGCVMVESTPAFPVKDLDWRFDPMAPHLLPPATDGIVLIYNEGTRGRWHWQCPDCAGHFEPRIDRLVYDATLDPGAAGDQAQMECPHCGSLLDHRHKVELNRGALNGFGGWLHEAADCDPESGARRLVRIDDPSLRQTEIASYHLNGAAAAFASWSEIVARYEVARRKFEADGDEIGLSGSAYTEIGVPYLRPERAQDGVLTEQVLRDGMIDAPRKVCPPWVRFVTVSVDVNGRWFAVAVTGWGLDGQRTILDRYDIEEAPAEAPRARDEEGKARAVDPGRYQQDSAVLRPLLDKAYPVEGENWSLQPIAMIIDFNGPVGWPDNAEKFWRKCQREGLGRRVFLSIGRGGFKLSDRVWHIAPSIGSRGKKARSIKLLNMAVDRIKDSVLSALARADGGPNSFPLPRWFEQERLMELLAERRAEAGYIKRNSMQRNETLDLAVQAQAGAEHLGLTRIDPAAPPAWATLSTENQFAIWTGGGAGPSNSQTEAAARLAQPKRMKWAQR